MFIVYYRQSSTSATTIDLGVWFGKRYSCSSLRNSRKYCCKREWYGEHYRRCRSKRLSKCIRIYSWFGKLSLLCLQVFDLKKIIYQRYDSVDFQWHFINSLTQNRIWSFQHNYFHFDPLQGDFDVAGLKYQWDDGIFSITLGNRQPDGYRTAYFHPMARFLFALIQTVVIWK